MAHPENPRLPSPRGAKGLLWGKSGNNDYQNMDQVKSLETVLYPLPLADAGGDPESLTHYLLRLSAAHHVTPAVLCRQLLAQYFVFSQQGIPSVAKKIPQGGGEFVLPDLAECGMALGQRRRPPRIALGGQDHEWPEKRLRHWRESR